MNESRAILHIDMDAFYASVEILENPEIQDKPVVVGGAAENRGVVAAASYKAREFGIHSAMSMYRAKTLCPDLVIISPRMQHYVEVSRRIFSIFEEFTPIVEPISIDEAFLDVTGSRALFGPATQIGQTIKTRIKKELGLTASVGAAPNKFLAKLASGLEKPDGFVVIRSKEAAAKLAPLPIGKIWGVGRVAQKEFAKHGVVTVKDMLALPPDRLRGIVGSYADKLRALGRGIDVRPVVVGERSKSIGAETTFAKDIADAERLRNCLDALAAKIATRVRKEGYRAFTVHIKARYPDFKTLTRSTTLHASTASTSGIRNAARELFENRLDRKGRPLRLIGVSVSNLVRPTEGEIDLFPDRVEEQHERVDRLVDKLQTKFGSEKVWRGTRAFFDGDWEAEDR